jgi:hypothetical protein
MLPDDTRIKIKNIICRIVIGRSEDNCTTTRNLHCRSFETNSMGKKGFESQSIIKERQKNFLEKFLLFTPQIPHRIPQPRLHRLVTHRYQRYHQRHNPRHHKHPPINIHPICKILQPFIHHKPRQRSCNHN